MIGTITLSGPCLTQVAVGMGEGVKVGDTVNVEDTVAVSVGGAGVNVAVDVAVGPGNNPVPHADNKIDIPRIHMVIFFIYFLMIKFPDDAQSIERQPGSDYINDFRFFRDDFRQAAGGDDSHVVSQFGPEP